MTKFQIVLASVITMLWVASWIIRMFGRPLHLGLEISDYSVLDSVAVLVFGSIFTVNSIKKMVNGNSKEPK